MRSLVHYFRKFFHVFFFVTTETEAQIRNVFSVFFFLQNNKFLRPFHGLPSYISYHSYTIQVIQFESRHSIISSLYCFLIKGCKFGCLPDSCLNNLRSSSRRLTSHNSKTFRHFRDTSHANVRNTSGTSFKRASPFLFLSSLRAVQLSL